jgi:hypothetical protein
MSAWPFCSGVIMCIDIPLYINILVFRTFFRGTLSSLSCTPLGCSSSLQVSHNQVLFSLASCGISHSDNTTPVGQPYILATLSPFPANILGLLQSRSAQIFLSIKELMKVKETVTEDGEDIEKIGEGNEDEGI